MTQKTIAICTKNIKTNKAYLATISMKIEDVMLEVLQVFFLKNWNQR